MRSRKIGACCGSICVNRYRAQASAVCYVLQPGGSIADAGVTAAADEYGMTMAFSGLRLFRN